MSDDADRIEDIRLTEADVESVLERAAALDATSGLSVAQLTDVAQEAGISQEAVAQAVREMLEERRVAVRPDAAISPSSTSVALADPDDMTEVAAPSAVRSVLSSVVAFGVMGAMVGALGPGDISIATFGVGLLTAVTILRAIQHREQGSFRAYQFELFTAWTAFLAGHILIEPEIVRGLVVGIGIIAIATAVAGGLIIQTHEIWDRVLALIRRRKG